MRTVCALLALGAAAPVRPGVAQVVRPFPLMVRMEGFVGDKPEGMKAIERWVFAVDGLPVIFHLTKLRVIGTDVAWWNITSNLAPLPITLTLYGDAALRRRFLDTPAGERIALTGELETGPGPVTLLVLRIEALPEQDERQTTPTPAPNGGAGATPAVS